MVETALIGFVQYIKISNVLKSIIYLKIQKTLILDIYGRLIFKSSCFFICE